MDRSSLRVLTVEPFADGSHLQFLEQWAERSRHHFDLITFPARHWKWRMRHSGLSAARKINALASEGQSWDVLFASSMVPLAELKGLSQPAAELPSVLYFHENQLTYPVREEAERDAHFAYSNFVSGSAADALWFNSAFHRDQWLTALHGFLGRFPDHQETDLIADLKQRSSVQWPGVERPVFKDALTEPATKPGLPFQMTWAARWEHDKNPEGFFEALEILADRRPELEWQVNVLGQRFRQEPECFAQARQSLGERVARWGFLGRQDYVQTLAHSDVFVSTAHHEFFGLSVVEAMLAGARPLLPARLSYPELVGGDPALLYDGTVEDLASRLESLVEQSTCTADGASVGDAVWRARADRFSWERRIDALDRELERVAAVTANGHEE